MSSAPVILVAEDDDADVFFLQRAFKQVELTNPVLFVADGMAAIDTLAHSKTHAEERLPGLVILDLKMPRRSGLQVLEWMRRQPVIRSIPVLVFTSSSNQSDIESAYEAGASGFLVKPSSSEERVEFAGFIKQWVRLMQPPLAAAEGFKAALAYRATTPPRLAEGRSLPP